MTTIYMVVENLTVIEEGREVSEERACHKIGAFYLSGDAEVRCAKLNNRAWLKFREQHAGEDESEIEAGFDAPYAVVPVQVR